jgi:HAD superfamily hydrolase (TIGR01509 family)
MPAVLFGSIGTVAETSELQRKAFNDAFAQHGLDWSWDRDDYRELLRSSGGEQRIADQARQRGEEVDAAAVHATKSELFQRALREGGVQARPGVVETVRAARERGYEVAWVTSTARESLDAVLQAVDLAPEDFDLITDATTVDASKPDPAPYAFALERLGESAADCVAVEDNVPGVEAAQAAGLRVAAFPNENTAAHDFAAADRVVDHLSLEEITA